MAHPEMHEKLFAFYDGELTGAARQEVEAHLAGCAECRQTYRQWQQTADALFQPSPIEASNAFVYRVMERIDVLAQPRRTAPLPMVLRWLVPALGLVGMLFLVLRSMPRTVSVETLLLADGRTNSPTQMLLASEPSTTDEVFGSIMMEEQP